MLIWVPVYWIQIGPANFLWLCDVTNFVILVGLWAESALLLSAAACGAFLIQSIWCLDFFSRLIFGVHALSGTEYMFDPAEPLWLRSLSLFHVAVPILLIYCVKRLGYDRRAFAFQSALAAIVLPLSFLPDKERNLNWVWKVFGVEQTWMPPWAWLLVCLLAYPLLIFWPIHQLLTRVLPEPAASRTGRDGGASAF